MEEKEFINKFLNIDIKEGLVLSTLALAIRGTRELSNRNVETGHSDELSFCATGKK